MRLKVIALALGSAVALGACSSNDVSSPTAATLAPGSSNSADAIDLMPDFEVSAAAVVDGGGVGASMLPDSLQLTADQKAQIEALHDAFRIATQADMDALRAIEAEARAARKADKSREEVRAILARAGPILDRLHIAFAKLQADILAIYTPAQRAWIIAHRPLLCGPDGPPALTEAQVAAIRALRRDFVDRYKNDIEYIRVVHKDADEARANGQPKAVVEMILARAKDAMARVRAAERKLVNDILNLLTPDQRAKWCILRPRGLIG